MTLQQKESIKTLILQQLKTLQKQIVELQIKSTTIVKDCSLDALNKVDMYYEHQREYFLVEQAKSRIEQLQVILQHVDDEEYGVCKECEEDIPFARLELLPESVYCVACLQEIEKNR